MLRQFWLHDLIANFRSRAELLLPVLFFVMVIALFPMALSVDPGLIQAMAPAVMWVAALLSALMALNGLLRQDHAEGFLEQCILSPISLPGLIFAKVWAHWLVTGLPLIILSPILGKMLFLSWTGIGALVISLLLGTPILSFIGAAGVGLTLGLRNASLLLTLLVLPLYVPVLIFGTSSVMTATLGQPILSPLLFLAAMLVLAITFIPWATAAAVRLGL
ncbi:MAG: heme exporter protein CcmB, partial [Gammaproteobacteria bacterium]|nr:heme exporter protein CcmB [Gammaproteobacteria bacterium]